MAFLKIRKEEDPMLYRKCREVTKYDAKLGQLMDDMFDTMEDADGVGLAGPQVGVLRRVIVMCVDGKTKLDLVNPIIVEQSGLQRGYEGCLSFPGQHGYVERPNHVIVRGFNRSGEPIEYEGTGLLARCICHEMDHLDGHVFLERVTEAPKDFVEEQWEDED